jgi:homoserine O-acetyltransferase
VADNEAELPYLQRGHLEVIPGVWGHRAGNPSGIEEPFLFLQRVVRDALAS